MNLPLLTRLADTLRYDRARGCVVALDRRSYPTETTFVECSDVEAVARAIAELVVRDEQATAFMAVYGLALAARAWQARPSDARRAAVIQAGEQLGRTRPSSVLRRFVEEGLARADAAILAGMDAEQVLADFVDSAIRRADKVAERCGRNAAGLLDDGDCILTHGFGGGALNWMLYVAQVDQGKQFQLYATESRPALQGAQITVHQALTIGVPVTLLADSAPGFCFAAGMFSVYIAGAQRLALDGSVASEVGTYQYAVLAQRHQIPFYVLGYDGPDPATPTGADIVIAEADAAQAPQSAATPPIAPIYAPGLDVTPPDLISAIVTSRGIYRPERIADHLRDGDAPPDVIPLTSSG